jgi:hypothetical protein
VIQITQQSRSTAQVRRQRRARDANFLAEIQQSRLTLKARWG